MADAEADTEGWYEDPVGEAAEEQGREDESNGWNDENDWNGWNEQQGGSESTRSRKRKYEEEENGWNKEWNNGWNKNGHKYSKGPEPQALARWSSNGSWRSQRSDSRGESWNTWNIPGISFADQEDINVWLECTNLGENVPDTPIVPCKTPFEGWLADRAYENGLLEEHQWFGKQELLEGCSEQGTPLGLVIDLVNTRKYYSGFDWKDDGVEYHKVAIPGRQVPKREVLEEVFDKIDEFNLRRPDLYVGLHCTHGLNRTGFLVAAYLMTRRDTPHWKDAVAMFEKARGGKMDKAYLLEALQQLEEGKY